MQNTQTGKVTAGIDGTFRSVASLVAGKQGQAVLMDLLITNTGSAELLFASFNGAPPKDAGTYALTLPAGKSLPLAKVNLAQLVVAAATEAGAEFEFQGTPE